MSTSIHLPKPLLKAIDRRARLLKISRNRFIAQTLEKELARGSEWSPGFFETFERIASDEVAAVDEMLEAIHAGRTRKEPPKI